MKFTQQFLLVSIMRKQGGDGVRTYLNSFHDYLVKSGINTNIFTPYSYFNIIVFPVFAARKLITPISSECSVWWYQYWHYYFLKQALKRELKKRAVTGKPQVIYAQCPLSAKAALESRCGRDQKVFMIVHFNISEADEWVGRGKIKQQGKLYRSIRQNEQDVISQLDGIVYVSKFMQNIVQSTIAQAPLVKSIRLPYFIKKPIVLNIEEKQKDLINIGTLESRKNQAYLLHVLAMAKRKGYSYSLTLVGAGPDQGLLENLSKKLGIRDQIEFLGYQKKATDFLSNHRVYVHSSLIDNLPIALLEALAFNLPILAGAVGGIPEIFNDGIEGFYWPLDNPEIGAEKLIYLLQNAEVYQAQVQAVQKRFSSHFEEDCVAKQHLSFLQAGPTLVTAHTDVQTIV
jgi:glycosyltransferase involved in cell wall biosynthesis